ncbi:MAG TPA: anhydro-N-acetylmuramic acid kinase, partial [Candidatus Kapabacteria bacterium]|nr:anhydro-N-acetylmuramic acid kinase [Candidatus Kapabacteria bacterium]
MNKFINILNSWHHTPQYIIGIMTGTSLDGIDTALCRIHTIDTTITLELCEYMCYEYPSEIKKEIQFLLNEPSPIS